MHAVLGVVLAHVVDLQLPLLVRAGHAGLHELLVVLRPLAQRELRDLQDRGARLRVGAQAVPLALLLLGRPDRAREVPVPRRHCLGPLPLDEQPHVCYDLARVVVGHGGAPASADALRAVDEHHRHDRAVPVGLDLLAVVQLVVQDRIVQMGEDQARQWVEPGVDVPGTGRVLPALGPGSELPRRDQEVDVVGAHEILRHRDDGAGQGLLAVVVGAVLADVSDELRNLHVVAQIPLEAAEEDLPLGRLQAIHHGGHGAHEIVPRELDELLVYEIGVADLRLRVVHV
mmetsp:Transcript_33395/g.89544  ORF Transcript_33395/g.89544 Transcript_33395/m.89544 type:complete len:286 (-) Transcript_33395:1184-2041(-)